MKTMVENSTRYKTSFRLIERFRAYMSSLCRPFNQYVHHQRVLSISFHLQYYFNLSTFAEERTRLLRMAELSAGPITSVTRDEESTNSPIASSPDANMRQVIAHQPDESVALSIATQGAPSTSAGSPSSSGEETNEKQSAGVAVHKINHLPSRPSDESVDQRRPTRPWRTTLIRFGPLSGIFAMLVAGASVVASLGVLAGSHGKSVDSWSAEPSIYLAIFTAIANLAMRYACIQGVVIAWWVRALRGSTIAKLHHDWRSGTTLRGAITAGRNIGLLGVATVFSTLVVIDGPLLQRASSVVPARITDHPVPLDVTMAPEVPTDYTGAWATMQDIGIDQWWNLPFNSTEPGSNGPVPNNIYVEINPHLEQSLGRHYFSDTLPPHILTGCHGTCKAKIRAPALALTSCKSIQLPVNYSQAQLTSKYKFGIIALPLEDNSFFISSSLMLDQDERINLVAGYSVSHLPDCAGTLNYTACTLQSAIGEYEVTVTKNSTILDDPAHPTIIVLANNTRVNHKIDPTTQARPSTLGGAVDLVMASGESQYAIYVENEDGDYATSTYNERVYSQYMLPSDSKCQSFADPFEDAYADLNKAMFIAGALAAQKDKDYLEKHMDPGLADAVNTTTTGHLVGNHNVFHTDYWFFFAAALVELVCIAFVAPTYWGWWKIGRPVSFSPVEMAKVRSHSGLPHVEYQLSSQAFDSPMFANCNSNSSGRDVAKEMVDVDVQYGSREVGAPGDSVKLTFSDPRTVKQPVKGARFDT